MRRAAAFALTCLLGLPAEAQTDAADRLLAEQRAALERQRAETAEAGLVIATAPMPEIAGETPCIEVAEIRVEGVTLLAADAVSAVLEPYARRCIGAAGIDALLQGLTDAYVQGGWITSRAFIPEQDLSTGVLRLVVVEGFVETIAYRNIRDGAVVEAPKPRRIRLAFPVETGRPLQLRQIEQGVDNLSSVPSAEAGLDIQPGTVLGGSVLAVTVTDTDRIRGTVGYRLGRTRETRRASLSARLSADNLFEINDSWTLSLSGAEQDNALALSVVVPVRNTRLAASVSYSETLTPLTPATELFEWTRGWSLDAERLLSRDATTKRYLLGGLRASRNARSINGVDLADAVAEAARLGWRGEVVEEGGFASWEIGLSAGRAPGLEERPRLLDARRVGFRTLESGATLYSVIDAQYAPMVLPSALQFSIGGAGPLRGFEGGAVSGSSGIRGSFEWGLDAQWARRLGETPGPLGALHPFLFADMGAVDSPDRPASAMVALGGGLRLTGARWTATLAAAVPVLARGDARDEGLSLRLDISPKLF